VTIKDNNATKEHLIVCAQEAWDLLEEDMLDRLAKGMQNQVDAIKHANGWYTKY
jgi:hypothetical protein